MTPSSGVGYSYSSALMPLVGSACPPVVAMLLPAAKILGPITCRELIASLKLIATKPLSPTCLTVVKPASRVITACFAANMATVSLSTFTGLSALD